MELVFLMRRKNISSNVDMMTVTGTSLLLAKEILSITGISINETGMEGYGIRFEMVVPKGEYRFFKNHDPPG